MKGGAHHLMLTVVILKSHSLDLEGAIQPSRPPIPFLPPLPLFVCIVDCSLPGDEPLVIIHDEPIAINWRHHG